MRHYRIQLINSVDGKAIQDAGGKAYISAQGSPEKISLLQADGSAATNPVALTNGMLDFYVADSVAAVDLFVQSPSGHFLVHKNVAASGPNTLYVDKSKAQTMFVIPFHVDDQTGDNTETLTGFTIPGAIQPSVAVDVDDIDATETIDVGTDSGESGDADAFIVGASVGTAGYIKATLLNSGTTLGAKLFVQDSANSGDDAPEQDISQIGNEISWTLSAGADTASGYILLPMQLPVSSL